jgi:hypothetical protein
MCVARGSLFIMLFCVFQVHLCDPVITALCQPCTVLEYSHTRITVLTPPGLGANKFVQVTQAGQTNSAAGNPMARFSYLAPVITSLSQNSSDTGPEYTTTITIYGDYLGSANETALIARTAGTAVVESSIVRYRICCACPPPLWQEYVQMVECACCDCFVVVCFGLPATFARAFLLGLDVADSNDRVIFGVDKMTLSPDHSWISVRLPEGVGLHNMLRVNVSGQASNAVPFRFNPPTITSVVDLAGNPLNFGTCCR